MPIYGKFIHSRLCPYNSLTDLRSSIPDPRAEGAI